MMSKKSFLVVLFFLLFLSAGFADSLFDGLISYYKLDEVTGTTVSDSYGTNTGTTFNMESGDWTSCKINNGLSFDHVNEGVSFTNLTYGHAGTISFWLDTVSSVGTSRDNFMGVVTTVGGKEQFLQITNWDNGYSYWGFEIDGSIYWIATATAFPDGFFHVIFRWDDNTGGYELLWNNVSIGNNTNLPTIVTHSQPIYLNNDPPLVNRAPNAKMDEIGFWSRWFSDDEVVALYNNGNGLSFDDFGDVATETQGQEAIENGIRDALGEYTPIYTNQSIFLTYADGSQNMTTFDKVARYGNQTFAFNYITSGETYQYTNNITNIFYTWEQTSMASAAIRTSVANYITYTQQ